MKFLILLLTVLAVPALNAQTYGDFDVVVNDGATVFPTGPLPDGEVGLSYNGARVELVGAYEDIPSADYHFSSYDMFDPWPAGLSVGLTTVSVGVFRWFIVGTPALVQSQTIGIQPRYTQNVSPFNELFGPIIYYSITIRPAGYGVTYPPPPGGGGGGSSSSSDDGSSCSTSAGKSYTLVGLMAAVAIMAPAIRRRRVDRPARVTR